MIPRKTHQNVEAKENGSREEIITELGRLLLYLEAPSISCRVVLASIVYA